MYKTAKICPKRIFFFPEKRLQVPLKSYLKKNKKKTRDVCLQLKNITWDLKRRKGMHVTGLEIYSSCIQVIPDFISGHQIVIVNMYFYHVLNLKRLYLINYLLGWLKKIGGWCNNCPNIKKMSKIHTSIVSRNTHFQTSNISQLTV